jgi:ABC-2 type transport system permease protein
VNTLALSLRQARFELKAFFRNPAAAFFTFVFPLMFLVIFNMVFGDTDIDAPGGQGKIDVSTFYVPAITAVSVIGACYVNMAMGIAFARDRGVLKRIHGTPLPPIAYFAGRILMAIVVSILLVVLILVVGVLAYGVEIQGDKMPAFILALVVGAASFCALGMAVACLVPNADAAPAIVQASILPLQFISNIYIPAEHAPEWVKTVAAFFPIVHFADALHAAFNPFESGSGLSVTDVAVLAAWGVAGVVFAMMKFSWEPSR